MEIEATLIREFIGQNALFFKIPPDPELHPARIPNCVTLLHLLLVNP